MTTNSYNVIINPATSSLRFQTFDSTSDNNKQKIEIVFYKHWFKKIISRIFGYAIDIKLHGKYYTVDKASLKAFLAINNITSQITPIQPQVYQANLKSVLYRTFLARSCLEKLQQNDPKITLRELKALIKEFARMKIRELPEPLWGNIRAIEKFAQSTKGQDIVFAKTYTYIRTQKDNQNNSAENALVDPVLVVSQDIEMIRQIIVEPAKKFLQHTDISKFDEHDIQLINLLSKKNNTLGPIVQRDEQESGPLPQVNPEGVIDSSRDDSYIEFSESDDTHLQNNHTFEVPDAPNAGEQNPVYEAPEAGEPAAVDNDLINILSSIKVTVPEDLYANSVFDHFRNVSEATAKSYAGASNKRPRLLKNNPEITAREALITNIFLHKNNSPRLDAAWDTFKNLSIIEQAQILAIMHKRKTIDYRRFDENKLTEAKNKFNIDLLEYIKNNQADEDEKTEVKKTFLNILAFFYKDQDLKDLMSDILNNLNNKKEEFELFEALNTLFTSAYNDFGAQQQENGIADAQNDTMGF